MKGFPSRDARLFVAAVMAAGVLLATQDRVLGQPHETPLSSVEDKLHKLYPNGGKKAPKYTLMSDVKITPPVGIGALTISTVRTGAQQVLSSMPEFQPYQMTGAYTGQARIRQQLGVAVSARKTRWVWGCNMVYKGTPLADRSTVALLIFKNGTKVYKRQRFIPTPQQIQKLNLNPTNKPQQATNLAMAHFKEITGQNNGKIYKKRQVAKPKQKLPLEIWVADNNMPHLAWAFYVKTPQRKHMHALRYWVSAQGEPKILKAENAIFHSGKVTAIVWGNKSTSGGGPTVKKPLENLFVTRLGGNGNLQRPTGRQGEYKFPPATAEAKFSVTLNGRFCRVQNVAGDTMKKTGQGASTGINFHMEANGEQQLAQTSAYYWVNHAQQFCKPILAPLPKDRQLLRLPTFVNIDDYCNAFYSPFDVSINFFLAGQLFGRNCPNTAYASVILHEYGHAVDDMLGGIPDGAYSEGFGDVLSILALRDPVVGRDFAGTSKHLRDYSDLTKVPTMGDLTTEEPHQVGQVYGGFAQKLINELRKKHNEDESYAIAYDLLMGAASFNPMNIQDAVLLSFLLDDNDGDLSNGSPHFAELAAAADDRKIERPKVPQS